MNAKELYAILAKISKDADKKELAVKQAIDCLDIAWKELHDTGKTEVDLKGLSDMLREAFK
jgi:hypothetical protein